MGPAISASSSSPRPLEERRSHDVEIADGPRGAAGASPSPPPRKLHLVHKESGRDAEADDVHQTVELGAEACAGAGDAGDPAIQRIEDAGEDDEPAGAIEF